MYEGDQRADTSGEAYAAKAAGAKQHHITVAERGEQGLVELHGG